jgi:hypothetical protein
MVRKFVSNIKEGIQTEGVWEQCNEENIWTEKEWIDTRNFVIYTLHQVYLELSGRGGWDRRGTKHELGEEERI